MEVIPQDCKNNPSCPHGPCLLFERHCANGNKTGKRFFACSACRDRSVCSFFHWADDEIPAKKKALWKKIIADSKPPYSHEECMKRLSVIQKLPKSSRTYCRTCSSLILPEEKNHQSHEKLSSVTTEQLRQPTSLFQSLQNKKAEAQYFFSENTVKFITKLLQKLGFSKLLLIGAPKIHEYVIKEGGNLSLSSMLLDIDPRYLQFFSPEQFIHYNLFNNHFFGGEECEEKVKQFLTESEGGKVAILIDPPFGGLVDAISYTLQTMNKLWQLLNSKSSTETVPLLWFFPYFLEQRIIKNFPGLVMMDYKVGYINHKKFRMKLDMKDSPVRIFTNIPPVSFKIPEKEGYKFCTKCKKYVFKENLHCTKCNACTTKHGKTYKHCDQCERCVKSSYVHCDTHNKCSPKVTVSSDSSENKCACNPGPEDGNEVERCFKCFGYGHRKRDCPINQQSRKKKKH